MGVLDFDGYVVYLFSNCGLCPLRNLVLFHFMYLVEDNARQKPENIWSLIFLVVPF